MNFREIIANVDLTSEGQYIDADPLIEHFGIECEKYIELEEHGFKEHPLGVLYIDYYHRGHYLLSHLGLPLCVVIRETKYGEPSYKWIDAEKHEYTKNIIKSIIPEEKPKFELLDMETDHGLGFEISFGSNIIGTEVILKETNERWKIKQHWKAITEVDKWRDLIIEKDGEEKEVTTDEVLIPWNNSSKSS